MRTLSRSANEVGSGTITIAIMPLGSALPMLAPDIVLGLRPVILSPISIVACVNGSILVEIASQSSHRQ